MKTKKILQVLSCFVFTASATAQTTISSNALSGTPPSSPAQYLGSVNNFDVLFKSNNVERMRILSTGNVGIGTATPGAKLEVSGQVKITGGTPGLNKVLSSDAAGLASWSTLASIGAWTVTGNTAAATDFIGTINTQDLIFKTNNVERIRVLSTGNVGIGTATPGAKLEIAGQIKITGGTPGAGKVLTSDASGLASWSTVAPSGAWAINGNVGSSSDFIGTINNIPFRIKVNNTTSGIIDNTLNNAYYGFQSGTAGNNNTGMGSNSLSLNTGNGNTAIGSSAMPVNNMGSFNTAVGNNSLSSMDGGQFNTAVGYKALYVNTANLNTAIGAEALISNNGSQNVAAGYEALYFDATGSNNVAEGYRAGYLLAGGTNNTFLGSYAGVGDHITVNNSAALGANSTVDVSNKIRVGNPTVTVIEGEVAFSIPSDGRFKENITEEVKGIEFIKLLRPVVYNFNTRKFQEFLTKNLSAENQKQYFEAQNFEASTAIRQSGFIAQEVEKAASQVGYNFNGIHVPENENDNYSLAYSEFVVPLVKAVQEQQQMIDSLNATVVKQSVAIQSLQDLVNKLIVKGNTVNATGNSTIAASTNVILGDKNTIVLEQNIPNPFAEQTTINYFLPDHVKRAEIIFFEQTGKMIKTVQLTEKGKGSLNVFASDLSNGIYSYSLVVDGETVETKKMMKTK